MAPIRVPLPTPYLNCKLTFYYHSFMITPENSLNNVPKTHKPTKCIFSIKMAKFECLLAAQYLKRWLKHVNFIKIFIIAGRSWHDFLWLWLTYMHVSVRANDILKVVKYCGFLACNFVSERVCVCVCIYLLKFMSVWKK